MATARQSGSSPPPRPAPSAVDLLKGLGLFVDGPVLWGRPVRTTVPGVFVIELGAPVPHAPIDPNALRAWLERVPELRLDGARPTVGELQGRLAGLWLPEQTVVYAWYSPKSIGARVAAMHRTALGDPRPNPAGQLLKTLRGHDQLRVWWAETDAPQEFADALLSAFAENVDPASAARLGQPTMLLPFANEQSAALERRQTGITGATLPTPDDRLRRPTHVTLVPPEPEPARPAPAPRKPRPTPPVRTMRPVAPMAPGRAAPDSAAPSALSDPEPRRRTTRAAAAAFKPIREPVYLSAEGIEALRAELQELETIRRPQILARIKAARELGDLSENADYESARHEQSFNEGRIQTLTDQLERAVMIDASGGHLVDLGSTVVVESDREGEETFTIVGSLEADAAAGRISNSSPIGRALLGHRAGDAVAVSAPAGAVHYRIIEVH